MKKTWAFLSITWLLIAFSLMFTFAMNGYELFIERGLFTFFKFHVIIGIFIGLFGQFIPSKKQMNL